MRQTVNLEHVPIPNERDVPWATRGLLALPSRLDIIRKQLFFFNFRHCGVSFVGVDDAARRSSIGAKMRQTNAP